MPTQSNPVIERWGAQKRWVLWRYEERDGKPTKVPYQATGERGDSTDPATWGTYAEVSAALDRARDRYAGVGIVFPGDKLSLGIDLDHKIEAGEIAESASAQLVTQAGTYAETSPSGTGLHLLLELSEPLDLERNKEQKLGYEVYTQGRYFTFTGKPWGECRDIRTVTPAEALALLDGIGYPWRKSHAPQQGANGHAGETDVIEPAYPAGTLSDSELIERMFAAKNGAQVRQLWDGSTAGYPSQSEADLALLSHLGWWTDYDEARTRALFLSSELGKRSKAQDRADYLTRSIATAFEGKSGGYSPRPRRDTHATAPTGATAGEGGAQSPRIDRRHMARDEAGETTEERAGLPGIQINGRPMRDVTTDAIRALAARGEVFVRGGELVRVQVDEHGRASIATIGESALRGMLDRAADFYRLIQGSETPKKPTKSKPEKSEIPPPEEPAQPRLVEVIVDPPLKVVRDVLSLGNWPEFYAIEGVIESPTMRADGTILSAAGYDPATRLFYLPAHGFRLPDLPERPTREHVAAALTILAEVIADFPFDGEASKANALGLLITPLVRPMIAGPVPVALIDAPQAGTGKTLIAKCVARIATGEDTALTTAPDNPEEWRKKLTSELAQGKPTIIIDNVTGAVKADELAAAVTASVWSDRILGTNKTINLPQRATWMVTGNNIRLAGDLPRRSFWVRLDAQTSRPWQRDPEKMKHPHLEKWVSDNRALLVGAALTLARAWVIAGRPRCNAPMIGGFDDWREIVGGILAHAGVTKFLGNLSELYEIADEDTPQWERFLGKCAEIWPGEDVTTGVIYSRFSALEDLAGYVPDDFVPLLDSTKKDKFLHKLGLELRSRLNKRHGDSGAYVARIKPSGRNPATWRFHAAKGEPTGGG